MTLESGHLLLERKVAMLPDRPSDEQIFECLGAAVVLCWARLPLGVREQILNQAGDVVGLAPVSRKDIVKLLLRHAKAQWTATMQRLR